MTRNGLTYAQAGVDIAAGDALVKRIKPLAAGTRRPGADASLGGFGALFDLKAAGYTDPLLVSTTDGVGTKLRVAIETGLHDGVGIDLVAMCVNDLLAQGAEPLLFLDYFATAKLSVDFAERVVAGIAEGCRQAGAALVGGETAEMPGMYGEGDYDLAGFCVGAVDRGGVLPRLTDQRPGDVMIALASSGPHSNGYSLIRRVVEVAGARWSDAAPFADGATLGEALMMPTRIYVPGVLPLAKAGLIEGAAHITGGGLIENPPRAIAPGLAPRFDWNAWTLPPVFQWLQAAGGIADEEMRRTFNCGVGFLLIVSPDSAEAVLSGLLEAGEEAFVCGELRSSLRRLSGVDVVLAEELGDLDGGVFGAVRTMHRILAHRDGVELADGAVGGLGGVGGPHDFPVPGHRVGAFEHLHHHRPGDHEIHQLAVERPRLVHLIERLSLGPAHADAALSDDSEARVLDHGVDPAGQVPRRGVGFDDREGAFGHGRASSCAGGI